MSLRLSVPSYVIPGTYVENLRFLEANTAQRDVELLFFIYDDDARALLRAEARDIASFAPRFGFTVHLPDSIAPEHEEILEATAAYASSFVVHPPRGPEGMAAFVATLEAWRGRYGQDRFLLENTRLALLYAAEEALAASRLGLPRLCADIGHLLMEGEEPSAWVAARADRISELHVHGFDGRKDHVPFGPGEAWIGAMAPFARDFDGIVEVELFSWPDQESAQAALRTGWGLS